MQNFSDVIEAETIVKEETLVSISEEAKENFLRFLEEVKSDVANCSIVNVFSRSIKSSM